MENKIIEEIRSRILSGKDLSNIILAHAKYPEKPKKAFRKWDGKTPYATHPIWCATTISTETNLDEKTRLEGYLALLYHDVLEDTITLLPNDLPERVKQLVQEMTFQGGSKQEMQEIWTRPREVILYKLYDKVSNLLDGSWMDTEKRKEYEEYTQKLAEDVMKNYGKLNITRIAKAIALEKNGQFN
jgi:hypothetical protein